MDEAMKSRVAINSIPDKVSFNDMVIKACAMALKTSESQFYMARGFNLINHHVNIGVAVAVEDGLFST
jgi:pyruvate dehydrogenase E2 component (dihydrolipoamide acetyltransferase)